MAADGLASLGAKPFADTMVTWVEVPDVDETNISIG